MFSMFSVILGASKVPKNVPKIANVGTFWTLTGLIVAILVQILVEEVRSFKMSTHTSKSEKFLVIW